jgi:DNA-binding CsgD family transcriptional regulator
MRTAFRVAAPAFADAAPISVRWTISARSNGDQNAGVAATNLLSPRECEIAEMVARGLSNKGIARRLGISHWTVSTHLRRVFAKLDINGRVELCRLVTTCWSPRIPSRSDNAH